MNSIIQDVFSKVKGLFIWTSDADQFSGRFDDWRSYADQVERGETIRDDCDAFSMTCAELLVRAGVDPNVIQLVACKTETGENHLVCVADGWLMDNRQRTVWPWTQLDYKWESSMKMSEPGVWRWKRRVESMINNAFTTI